VLEVDGDRAVVGGPILATGAIVDDVAFIFGVMNGPRVFDPAQTVGAAEPWREKDVVEQQSFDLGDGDEVLKHRGVTVVGGDVVLGVGEDALGRER
jgi:hypothetical protein